MGAVRQVLGVLLLEAPVVVSLWVTSDGASGPSSGVGPSGRSLVLAEDGGESTNEGSWGTVTAEETLECEDSGDQECYLGHDNGLEDGQDDATDDDGSESQELDTDRGYDGECYLLDSLGAS